MAGVPNAPPGLDFPPPHETPHPQWHSPSRGVSMAHPCAAPPALRGGDVGSPRHPVSSPGEPGHPVLPWEWGDGSGCSHPPAPGVRSNAFPLPAPPPTGRSRRKDDRT